MSKNPIINALSASAYIIIIVNVMNFITHNLRNKPDTIGAPITVLSLLTLSVAVIAFLFFYQPLLLFIENKKRQAIKLSIQTVGIFAVFTAIVLTLLYLQII